MHPSQVVSIGINFPLALPLNIHRSDLRHCRSLVIYNGRHEKHMEFYRQTRISGIKSLTSLQQFHMHIKCAVKKGFFKTNSRYTSSFIFNHARAHLNSIFLNRVKRIECTLSNYPKRVNNTEVQGHLANGQLRKIS